MNKWSRRGGKGPLTHTLMNGGSYSVPTCETDEFFDALVNQLRSKKHMYVVERKTTPKFKMFMDVDYVSETKLSRDDIVDIVKKIHRVIPGRCVSAVAKPKPKDNLTKSGIHIHWSDLEVTKAQAIKLMNDVKESGEHFVNFIDDSVYKGSGLRMLWCHKKGKNGDEDPYTPFYDANTETFFADPYTPRVSLLKLFSIRVESGSNEDDDDTETINTESGAVAAVDDVVEKFVNACVKNECRMKGVRCEHEHVTITKINRKNKSIFIQTLSKFCMNKRECHKSNHTYFIVDTGTKELFQKCFDDECKKYEGSHHKVPSHIMSKLEDEAPRMGGFMSFEDFLVS